VVQKPVLYQIHVYVIYYLCASVLSVFIRFDFLPKSHEAKQVVTVEPRVEGALVYRTCCDCTQVKPLIIHAHDMRAQSS